MRTTWAVTATLAWRISCQCVRTPSIFEGWQNTHLRAGHILQPYVHAHRRRHKSGSTTRKALAVELLKSPQFPGLQCGSGSFRHQGLRCTGSHSVIPGQSILTERITDLAPTGTENSYLDDGLQLSWDMINASGGKGEMIVLSDGNLQNYPDVVQRSIRLIQVMNTTTRLIQVQAIPGNTGILDKLAAKAGSDFTAFSILNP